MRDFLRRHWVPIGLGILFLLQFLFVSPRGEFALNDDWVHAEMIKHWLDTGEFRFNSYVGPLLYWPMVYGAALTKLFGFSFTLLRLTTLAWTATLVGLTYFAVNKQTANRGLAAIVALTFWLNPISYNLSFTFMTDIPALALTAASAIAYWQALQTRQTKWLWLGSAAAFLGFFTRQTAGLLLPAFGLYLLWQHYKKRAPFGLTQWLPPLISAGLAMLAGYALLYWQHWLPGGTALHSLPTGTLLSHTAWWLWYIFIYTGLIAAPIAAGLLWQTKLWRDWRWWTLTLSAVGAVIIIKITTDTQLPYVLNILNLFGLGPNENVLNGVLQFQFPAWLWGAATVGAAGSAATLLYAAFTKQKNNYSYWWLWGALINAAPLLFVVSFDRYILPVALLFTLFLVSKLTWTSPQTAVAGIVILIISFYSLSQTAFYLNWNAARWRLADYAAQLQPERIEHIDGGYEWNGWHSYWIAEASDLPHGTWNAPWWIRSLFVTNAQDFIVSFSPIEPYQIVTSTLIEGHNPNNQLHLLVNPNLPGQQADSPRQ